MAEPFLGEIRMTGFPFAPKGWAQCNGQQMPTNQNQALFALLGTTFGGNGRDNFNLPDLRGRTPMNVGTQRNNSVGYGQVGGEETHTLTIGEMPSHTHTPMASTGSPAHASPVGNFWASNIPQYSTAQESALAPKAIGMSGGGQGHPNLSPYLVINFMIALTGIFPSRQ
jgi:microcystin-dependent protein